MARHKNVAPNTDDENQDDQAGGAPDDSGAAPDDSGNVSESTIAPADPGTLEDRVGALETANAEMREQIALMNNAIAGLQDANSEPSLPGVAGAGQREAALPRRQILYGEKMPAGQVFTGEAAIEKAKAEGWVENPSDLKGPKKPG